MAGDNKSPGYIKPVHFWLQLVTPLVYNDALSLYELMGQVVKKLNEVIDIVNPLGAGIEDTINQYLDKFKVEWEAELAEFQSQINNTINNNNTALNNRLDQFESDINDQQIKFEGEVNQNVEDFKATILRQVATLTALIQSTDEANRAWTMAQIEALKKDLTVDMPPVIDPTDGQLESVQTALNHMWDAMRDNALTATEYDGLELTATAYDAKELTAQAYDRYGKILLMPEQVDTVMAYGLPLKKSAIDMEAMMYGN